MEEETVNLDTLNETSDDEIIDPNLDSEEKVKTLLDKNRKLFERAKKAEGFIQDSSGRWVKRPPLVTESKISEVSTATKPSDILKADEFKLYRMGYNESEIDLIMHNGGAKVLEDKTNPIVLGLMAAKEQRSAEDAASRVVDSGGLSDIERKYSETDLRNMPKEELAKLLPHVVK